MPISIIFCFLLGLFMIAIKMFLHSLLFNKMISDFKRYFTSFLMYTLTPPAFDVDHYAQNGNFYFKLVDIGSIYLSFVVVVDFG